MNLSPVAKGILLVLIIIGLMVCALSPGTSVARLGGGGPLSGFLTGNGGGPAAGSGSIAYAF
ncbi:hypothetical protein AB2M95_12570 [Pseudomonas chlororaphis]|uniref:hypothetical protein n=1 Tax=Pseudomonas chlororaphis TaxID=587753 RepID=UPI0034618982